MDQMIDNTGFQIFAAFVALNTLVYVGLTLSRLIPWPRPLELTYVADRSSMVDIEDGEGLHKTLQDQLSGGAAVAQIAKGFLWLGLVALAVAVFEVWDGGDVASALIAMTIALVSMGASLLLVRQRVPLVAASWLWALLVTAGDCGLIIQAGSSGDSFRYAFALVIMAGYGILCWSYVPLVVTMGIQISVLVASLYLWPSPGALQWLLAAITAAVAGVFMVNQRRRGAVDIGVVIAATDALGLRDPRTGVWTPRGLQEVARAVEAGTPHAGGHPVCVIVDFPHLDALRDSYGDDFASDLTDATLEDLSRIGADEGFVARISSSRLVLVSADPQAATRVEESLEVHFGVLGLGKAPIDFTVVAQPLVSGSTLREVLAEG
jgi:GGDEF domain-containing protein